MKSRKMIEEFQTKIRRGKPTVEEKKALDDHFYGYKRNKQASNRGCL